jgi:hypothetical protein
LSAPPSREAQAWALALDYDELAGSIAHEARRVFRVPFEDGLQAARIGLYRAALELDETKGTYPPLARRRAIDELRRIGGWPRGLAAEVGRIDSLDEPTPWGCARVDLLASTGPRPDAEVELCGDRWARLSGLARPERQALLLERLRELGGAEDLAALVSWGIHMIGLPVGILSEDVRRLLEGRRLIRQGRRGCWVVRLQEARP